MREATPARLRTQARRWWAQDGLDLVIVDYVQRMQAGTPADRYNRVQALAEITGGLKDLAGELNIPVLAAAQVGRQVDDRKDKRPMLADLRESASLEMDSDVVMFIYRDDYYFPDTEKPNVAEIIVAKHRNGPTGTVDIYFKKELAQFSDLHTRKVNMMDF